MGATPAPFQGRHGGWGGENPCTPPPNPNNLPFLQHSVNMARGRGNSCDFEQKCCDRDHGTTSSPKGEKPALAVPTFLCLYFFKCFILKNVQLSEARG